MRSMPQGTVITLGVFDGVHLGHARLIKQALSRAKKMNCEPVAYTFHPHPVHILAPHKSPLLITTLNQRVDLLNKQGIRKIVVQKFTRKLSQMRAADFLNKVLVKKLQAKEIVVGFNFTFGQNREGDADFLKKWSKQTGIPVHIVHPCKQGKNLISSSAIRQLLQNGLIQKATKLLGHPYVMEGVVVKGKGIGKKILGIPTANLKSKNDLLLPTGVYETIVHVVAQQTTPLHKSITNIGLNPTFMGKHVSIETHLLNFNGNLVGKNVKIIFLERIRGEKKFASPEALKKQIIRDINRRGAACRASIKGQS